MSLQVQDNQLDKQIDLQKIGEINSKGVINKEESQQKEQEVRQEQMGQNICGALNTQNSQQISNMEDISELDFNRNSTYKKLEQYSINICKEREISIVYNMMIQRLLSMGQFHLFEHITMLSTQEQKNDYLRYLESISHEMEVIDSLYHHFMKQSSDLQEETDENLDVDVIKHVTDIQNVEDISYEDYERLYSTGLKLIRQKQVALVILAGGRNLRFDKDLSKCTTDLGLPSSQFIIDIIGRKLKTLKDIVNNQNIFQMKTLWQRNNYFGFSENDVSFVVQNQFPITDMNGKLQLKNDTQCHLSPCGNGDVLLQLIQNKHINKLVEKGYKYVHFIGVDNLLVKPLDPLFLGIASENKKAINQKCVQVDKEESEFYRLANINGRTSIMEYESIKKIMKKKTQSLGLHKASINIYNNSTPSIPQDLDTAPAFLFNTLISVNFLYEFSRRTELKHTYESKVMKRYISDIQMNTPSDGTNIQQDDKNNVLVFEKQIGDVLELTDDISLLQVNENEEFAPIIYKKKKYSPEDAVIKLSNLHKRWLRLEQQEISENDIIEVCPYVSYGGEGLDNYSEYLRANWKTQQFPLYINLRKINQHEPASDNYYLQNGNGNNNTNQHTQSFLFNEERRNENPSMHQSIDNNLQNADQSFNQQRKETDLIHKSFNHAQGNHSNRQIPTSSKNIQQQILIDDPHINNHNNMNMNYNNYNNTNGNNVKINQNENRTISQNELIQIMNENKNIIPTSQVMISQNKIL